MIHSAKEICDMQIIPYKIATIRVILCRPEFNKFRVGHGYEVNEELRTHLKAYYKRKELDKRGRYER